MPVLGTFTACNEDLMSYSGGNKARFADATQAVYSFAYLAETIQLDTIDVDIMTVGEVTEHARTVRFEQVKKDWKYSYDPNDANKIIDSTYVEMDFPAEEGKHFELLNAKNGSIEIPAQANKVTLQIKVNRADPGLKKEARKLYLRLVPNETFGIISEKSALKKIILSDKLEKPAQWKGYYADLYLGNWSEVKHRFMINVTGQKWDDAFIKYYIKGSEGTPLRNFWLAKIEKALEAYNANPANNPPMKDENGKIVEFPK